MSYFNTNSPECFVRWVHEKFFKLHAEDLRKPEVLNAVKSWIAIGNEHYSSYHPWIGLRTYIFVFCYGCEIDLIEDCLDIDLALEILGGTDEGLEIRNPSRKNLKNELFERAHAYITEKPRPDSDIAKFLVHLFACYTVLLNQIKQLENSL